MPVKRNRASKRRRHKLKWMRVRLYKNKGMFKMTFTRLRVKGIVKQARLVSGGSYPPDVFGTFKGYEKLQTPALGVIPGRSYVARRQKKPLDHSVGVTNRAIKQILVVEVTK